MEKNCAEFDNGIKLGTVEGKIHAIVASLQTQNESGVITPHYIYCNWAQANVALDKVEVPSIVYVLPPSGTLDFTWNRVYDAPSAQIAFVVPTDFDFDSEENEDLIEHMKRLCIKFILAVNESGMFESVEGKLPYRVLYDHLNQNVTGIVIEPRLKETDGIWICTDPEIRQKFVKLEELEDSDNV